MLHKKRVITILGVLSAIGSLSIDMYLPAFKVIAAGFNSTEVQIGYTLSSFLLGICAGQLISGPLLDHYGRKRILFIGLLVYIISSVACGLSVNYMQLMIFRFVQALGASIGIVAPSAIVRQLFQEQDRPKTYSLIFLILGVSPIIAPSIGSLILNFLSWPFIFFTAAAIILILLFAIRKWLPEQAVSPEQKNFSLFDAFAGYGLLLRDTKFTARSLAIAIGSAASFSIVGGAPLLFLDHYQLSEQQFGWVFAFIASGLIIGGLSSRIILNKVTSFGILKFGLPAQVLLGLAILVSIKMGLTSMLIFIVLLFFFLLLQGMIYPNLVNLTLKPIEQNAGSATALMGSFRMAFGAFAAFLSGFLYTGNETGMSYLIFLFVAVSGGIFYFFARD
jgi:DHA1 family bicyclomycin/chloramphenicol resistance-like MFS transporter